MKPNETMLMRTMIIAVLSGIEELTFVWKLFGSYRFLFKKVLLEPNGTERFLMF